MSDFKLCLIAVKIALFVFSWMMDGAAFGQYVNVRATRQQCFGTYCTYSDCLGSGVSIGKDATGRSVVLTAGHCIAGGAQRYSVGSYNKWIPAASLGHQGTEQNGWRQDVGILASREDVPNPVPLADAPPIPGTMVTIHSFLAGDGKKFRMQSAKVVAVDADSFTLTGITQSGDSGGAVMQNGKLVGLVSATGFNPLTQQRTEPTVVTSITCIRRFVLAKLGRIPDCGRPNVPQPPVEQPLPEVPPAVEQPPAPTTPPQTNIDIAPLLDAIAGLRAEIEVLKNKTLPVELYDETTGALIDRREIQVLKGEPIRLGNRSKKVK